MSKIRESAKGETCTFRIPGVCNNNPETVVLCHAPHPDKGVGKKGPDYFAAYGCSACHDEMDGRTDVFFQKLNRIGDDPEYLKDSIKKSWWFIAIRSTQRRLVSKKLLRFD